MEPRERVILKSIELFTRSGIRLVTMDQIALEVGMSKRTIYEMFTDKDTLVWDCLEVMDRQHLQELKTILDSSANVIEALYLLGKHSEAARAKVNYLFFEDLKKLYPRLWARIMEKNTPGPGSFTSQILEKGIAEKIFQNDINVEIVDVFIHVIMETIHRQGTFPEGVSDKELIRNIFIPYYYGISTEKGKKLIDQYIPLVIKDSNT